MTTRAARTHRLAVAAGTLIVVSTLAAAGHAQESDVEINAQPAPPPSASADASAAPPSSSPEIEARLRALEEKAAAAPP